MSDEPIILGQQLAAAHKAESERIARGDSGDSPLRPFERYDDLNGDLNLHDPVKVPLDKRLIELCLSYQLLDPPARAAMRRSLNMDDLYTLFTFARRAAVFGWRNKDVRTLIEGLTAISMIEINRVDWRDAVGPPFVIFAVFHELGLNPTRPFTDAAALAEPDVSELLLSFHNRPVEHRTLKAAGYAKVDSPHGPGLISSFGSSYQPTVPLDQAILQLAQLLRENHYSAHAEVAAELPNFWLSKIDDGALAAALRTVVAGASAHARPLPEVCPDYASQGIIVFLVETADRRGAETLIRLARQKQSLNNDFSIAAAHFDRLFCIFIARSFMVGVDPIETQKTILRFLPDIERILRNCI